MTNYSEREYLLALSLFDGIGPKRWQIIKKRFGSAGAFWQAQDRDLTTSGLTFSIRRRWEIFRRGLDLSSFLIRLEKKMIKFATIEEGIYPKLLKEIPNPPLVLYYLGSLTVADSMSIAVIGSRRPTDYGREVTQKLTAELVDRGFTIVSGLARGIDSIAHRVALGRGGRTVAVLGSGLDIIYPPEHRSLAQAVIAHGALVSEYPPGQLPSPAQFPARNRIISGMSLGVLITEGANKSGTRTTASFAADQGREVFCVPGPIFNPLSSGPAELIKVGAKLTTGIDDILDELQYKDRLPKKEAAKPAFGSLLEEKAWQALVGGGLTCDQLAVEFNLPAAEVLAVLTALELKGLVQNLGNGKYMAG